MDSGEGKELQKAVLILVVMDDALVHQVTLWQPVNVTTVLILVVMDDALVHTAKKASDPSFSS